jgi:hydrogenase-1 operon protein HyaF
MSALSDTSVHVAATNGAPEVWGNSLPILHEVRHGLKRLAETGESTLIDLRAIPFGPGDEVRLLELLGEGEVTAKVDALGPTRVWETAVKGVWIVDHRDLDEQRLALNIEVATIPNILRTQPEDVEDAIRALDERLAAVSGDPAPESRAP